MEKERTSSGASSSPRSVPDGAALFVARRPRCRRRRDDVDHATARRYSALADSSLLRKVIGKLPRQTAGLASGPSTCRCDRPRLRRLDQHHPQHVRPRPTNLDTRRRLWRKQQQSRAAAIEPASPPTTGRKKWLSGFAKVRQSNNDALSEKSKREKAAEKFGNAFKRPSLMVGDDGEDAAGPPRFQQVTSKDPTVVQPRSFVEFHKVITRGHREAHPFSRSEVDPMGFASSANVLRQRLKKMNRMIINPKSTYMQWWDCYMLFLLIYWRPSRRTRCA